MADIHIGKTRLIKDVGDGVVEAEIFFHVPNAELNTNNKYPGLVESLDSVGNPIPVSSAPGVTADELINLKNGTLCEVIVNKKFDLVLGQATISTTIRNMWHGISNKNQIKINKEYNFYGTELAKM
jgi:hypothetical protein